MANDYETAGSWKRDALVHYVSRRRNAPQRSPRALCGTRWSRFWRLTASRATCEACVEEAARRLREQAPPHRRGAPLKTGAKEGPRTRPSVLSDLG